MPESCIVLIRHGQAHCNLDKVCASASCRGLTPTGHDQAARLARRLHREHRDGYPILRIITSPVLRVRQTAQPLLALLGDDAEVVNDLAVPHPGPNAEGYRWSTIRERWPTDPDRPSRPLPQDGESWASYLARAHACLAPILHQQRSAPGRTVIIGHAETYAAIYTFLTGTAHLGSLRVGCDHTGLTRFVATSERPGVHVPSPRWQLAVHNDTAHLTAARSSSPDPCDPAR
jgi:probable phosphoglycerate mutase